MNHLTIIFFASGFAGLIYESIWTHYLKLFLGHAAYAQALVLGIFMGGMAVGAAIAARHTERLRNPLRTYAGIEFCIGLYALIFHPLFNAATSGFLDFAFLHHPGGASFAAAKWTLASSLILPPAVLLGATFPLFAAAVTRGNPAAGRSIATLYFANSMGGALGVVASGFVLIPALGLPGTLATAGAINLLIGAIARHLSGALARPALRNDVFIAPRFGRIPSLLVAVSFLTGATSFIYEMGWIRMLSLVLGSATHAFELMLCAFIAGLALGGLWVRKRIDTAANPGVFLGHVQIAMGAAAIATLPLYSLSFDFIGWVIGGVAKTSGGYALFNLARYGVAMLVMFPAAFCAGMTLPLATRLLQSNEGQGERAIGMIYSANTLGAISGLAFAIGIGFPLLGLDYLVATGALLDVALGLALVLVFAGRHALGRGLAVMAACASATAFASVAFNPQKLVSGVFRTGTSTLPGRVVEIAHGRTATISVEQEGAATLIRTNGKPDASAVTAAVGEYRLDEVTMSLMAVFPMLLHDAPRRVANIGFGSGITSATMLEDPRVRQLDTIEIEPEMVRLAQHFGVRNRRAYTDPRSAIHIDDAKSFFAANGQTYDVIISEPSNPWVSGVAGLFSVEFYRHIRRYLNQGGLFVQWIQLYETHPDRVASIIKALDQSFSDYLVVGLNYGDLLLIAAPRGRITLPATGFSHLPVALRQRLDRLDIANQSDIALRVVANKALLKPWIDAKSVPANSDFAPYLDTHADADRFVGIGWADAAMLAVSPFPIAETFGYRAPFAAGELPTISGHFGGEPRMLSAWLMKAMLNGGAPVPAGIPDAIVQRSARLFDDCQHPPAGDKAYALAAIATRVLPYLPRPDARALLDRAETLACFQDLHPDQALWPALLRHVADRDSEAFGRTAEQLLDQGQGATKMRAHYLIGMALLGQLRQGNRARAKEIWLRHRMLIGDEPLNLGLAILRDQAFAQSD